MKRRPRRTLLLSGLLLLAGAIIGSILLARRALDQARVAYSNEELEITANALDAFRRARGCYPTQTEFAQMAELEYLTANVAADMWGRPFIYEPRDCHGFTLRFLGRDGRFGGTGFDSDVAVTEASRVPASARP